MIFDLLERALQTRPKRIKRFTVKRFDHENAVRLQPFA